MQYSNTHTLGALSHAGQIDQIDHDLHHIDHDLDQIDHDLDQIDHNLDHIDHDLDQIDHNLDHIDHDLDQIDQIDYLDPIMRLCRCCIIQIQPRKYVIDHADYTAPRRQHELYHTDQESICPERSRS